MAGLDHGAEIVGQITDIVRERKIESAFFHVIGALSRAEVACYDQAAHEYKVKAAEEPLEIASCSGNISLLEGRPFVHAHAVLCGSSGRVWAGHLMRGNIFAAELFLLETPGANLHRTPDAETGLNLWSGRESGVNR